LEPVLRGLYAITDPRLTAGRVLEDRVRAALRGGARLIQYRDKGADTGRRLAEADLLQRLCIAHDASLIVNDDVELAARVGAAGVHLGRTDTGLSRARERLGPRAIIGISCYDRLDLALAAQDAGADYVAFGSFFPSPTKPDAVEAPLSLLERARERLDIPICAIGGITLANAGTVIAAGADMIAVISDLFGAVDVEARAQALSRLVDRTVA
jgi:thiamine-phosphate pyrophosphorylase